MMHDRLGGLSLSRLMLGTVQFGLNYGIANRVGQPTYETAREIIACAYDGGVTCLDTAALYGDSEEVLGRALSDLKIADRMTVATKVCHLADDLSASEADAIVEESVACSLRRLRLDVLPICLFHDEDNFIRYADSLLKLRDRGVVRCAGSSVTTPEAALRITRSGLADAVQMPTSVLDRRFVRSGVCEEAARQGIALFARSIYLQGLLLMPEDDVLPELADVIPVRRNLQALATQAGMSISELAVRYVLAMSGITSAVVGVDSVAQMRENVALFNKGPLPEDLFGAVADAVPDLPESILFPAKWSKRMPDAKPRRNT
jgi:aryl-alcohol dehydrogenase-like predicted oxidoreductase